MKRIVSFACIMALAATMVSCSKDEGEAIPTPALVSEVSYKIMPQEEAKEYFLHEKFHEQITPLFIDLAMQRHDVPHEEWLNRALSAIHEPMPEKQALLDSIARVQSDKLRSMGLSLPIPKTIDIVDMKAETIGGSYAFTSGTRIYANLSTLKHYEAQDPGNIERVMWHEMWHVMSRNNPELRKQMYALLGFHVLPDEVEIPDEVKARVLCNTDVERHDSYATFTINGKPTDCMLLLYVKDDKYIPWILSHYISSPSGYWLLALDPETHKPYRNENGEWAIYNCREVEDFDQVMSGGNTNYCNDPEECMADNFAFAMMNNKKCPNQKILQDIRDLMKQQMK